MESNIKREELIRKIRTFLCGSAEEVIVTCIGDIVDVDVQWIDGPTVSEMRSFVIAEVPMLNNIHCERIFSDKTISGVLAELYASDLDINARVEHMLYDRNLSVKK